MAWYLLTLIDSEKLLFWTENLAKDWKSVLLSLQYYQMSGRKSQGKGQDYKEHHAVRYRKHAVHVEILKEKSEFCKIVDINEKKGRKEYGH